MEKEHLIVYNNSPYSGVWTSKTNLLRFGVGMFPTPFTSTGKDGIFYLPKQKAFYINLKDGALPGEIIVVGVLNKEYRVLKGVKLSKNGKRGFRIQRMDGENITPLDIKNAQEGAKVRIRGRKTSKEISKIIDEL